MEQMDTMFLLKEKFEEDVKTSKKESTVKAGNAIKGISFYIRKQTFPRFSAHLCYLYNIRVISQLFTIIKN